MFDTLAANVQRSDPLQGPALIGMPRDAAASLLSLAETGRSYASTAIKRPTYDSLYPGNPLPSPAIVRDEKVSANRFILLEKWDGMVLDADEETFTARLVSSLNPLEIIEAVFENEELGNEERGQIAVGASFVWTIGYREIGSTRHRDSVLYFRRLPAWGKNELDAARQRGEELRNAIGWNKSI